jgi:hypothetical protein
MDAQAVTEDLGDTLDAFVRIRCRHRIGEADGGHREESAVAPGTRDLLVESGFESEAIQHVSS